jgi:hypothetical protein
MAQFPQAVEVVNDRPVWITFRFGGGDCQI